MIEFHHSWRLRFVLLEMTLNIFPLSLAFVDDCSGINASDCMINTQCRAMTIDGKINQTLGDL